MSFASLTQTTLELIRAAVSLDEPEERPEGAKVVAGGLELPDGTVIPGVLNPDGTFSPTHGEQDDDEEGRPRVRPFDEFKGWQATDRTGFEQSVNWMIQNVFTNGSTGLTTGIDAFLNDWAVEWRLRNNIGLTAAEQKDLERLTELLRDPELLKEEAEVAEARGRVGRTVKEVKAERDRLLSLAQPDVVPTLERLFEDDDFARGAAWLPLTLTNPPPSLFESTVLTGEGIEVPAVGVASLLTGVEFIEITETLQELKQRPQTLFEVARRGRNLVRRALTTTEPGEPDDVLQRANVAAKLGEIDLPDYMKTLILHSDPAAEGRVPVEPLKVIPQTVLFDQLVNIVTPSVSRGSGTTTRRDIIFDRDQLVEQVNGRWQSWFLEGANEQRVNSIVDAYVDEARAFWNGQAGKLDFDTFVNERLRQEARYKAIFRNKPGGLTEEQFIGQFQQPIAQLGLGAESALRQTEAAVTSGGSITEQLKRVTRSSEFQLQGGFSQRLARTLSGLGGGVRG